MWKRELVELLLIKYQHYDHLYNVRHPDYVNKVKRCDALFEIYSELKEINPKVTVDGIKSKMHTLRSQYIKELKKISTSKRSSVGMDQVYEPKLWCFYQMEFLRPHYTKRSSSSNISNDENEEDSNPMELLPSAANAEPAPSTKTDAYSEDSCHPNASSSVKYALMETDRCRVCFSNRTCFEWNIIVKDDFTYADFFYKLTGLDESRRMFANYMHICAQCAEVLNNVVDFIEKAHRTDRILRSMHKNTKPSEAFESVLIEPSEGLKNEPSGESMAIYSHNSQDYSTTNHDEHEEIKLEDEIIENGTFSEEEGQLCEIFIREEPKTTTDLTEDCKIRSATDEQPEVPANSPVDEAEEGEAEHNSKSLDAKKYCCELCKRIFANKYTLTRHMQRLHNCFIFLCNICDKNFEDKKSLQKHLIHHKMKGETAQHVKPSENNEPPVVCEICHKQIKNEKMLKIHKSRMHEESPRLLCHACPLTFKNQHSLSNHAKTHTERERNFICHQCGMRFYTFRLCREHVATHDTRREPQYHCDQCDKSFLHHSALTTHKKCHNEAGFACKICPKVCYRLIDLQVHTRSHTGETPFPCHLCEKAFQYKHALSDHLRRHRGEKLKCDLCDLEFGNRSTLKRHRFTHTGEPLRCGVCDKGFIKLKAIRKHISELHKITSSEEVGILIYRVKTMGRYKQPKQCKDSVEPE